MDGGVLSYKNDNDEMSNEEKPTVKLAFFMVGLSQCDVLVIESNVFALDLYY